MKCPSTGHRRVAVVLLLAAIHTVGQAQLRLNLRPGADGRLRVEATNPGTNSVVVEQTSGLDPASPWSLANVVPGGVFRPTGAGRFLRLRVIPPAPPATAGAASLLIEDPPAFVRGGATATFRLSTLEPTNGLQWFVDGLPGGSAGAGIITVDGRFTAPVLPTNRVVEVRARLVAADGRVVEAMAFPTVLAPALPGGPTVVTALAGGVVESPDGELRLVVPPGALATDRILSVSNLLDVAGAQDTGEFATLALFSAHPDGVQFAAPARVEFPLNQWVEPGTELPLSVAGTASPTDWHDEAVATVLPGGLRATAALPHFSLWSVRRRLVDGPTLPAIPVVTNIEPARLYEGGLRPLLLSGAGLGGVRTVTVLDAAGGATALVSVRSLVRVPAAPHQLGVLLKSVPNPAQPAGRDLLYRLRLTVGSGRFTEVIVTVAGLDEFELQPQQVVTVPALPATNRALFSRIRLSLFSTLTNRARVLAWQATDEVTVGGTIIATGVSGPPGEGLFPGQLPEAERVPGGAGSGAIASHPTNFDPAGQPGTPALVANLNEFLPGSLNRIFGQPGSAGSDAAPWIDDPLRPLEISGEAIPAHYDTVLAQRLGGRDADDFNFWHQLADELTETHPEGRKGQQGRPGGFVARPPWSGFHLGARVVEPGGGGGGGGGSYRPWGYRLSSAPGIGLGGGSGGGGGRAVSWVSGGVLNVTEFSLVDTSGGNGGDGGRPSPAAFNNWASLGQGGGGGPGGAGTIHLLAGERLFDTSRGGGLRHSAGRWGTGGFLMTLRTHNQATPKSWYAPIPEPPATSQAEVAGPDFDNSVAGLQTGIRVSRLIEARAMNPTLQPAVVRVLHRSGEREFRVRGVNAGSRRIRLLLQPGTNSIIVAGSPDHAVLNREIIVLDTPDTDGDGIGDADEILLGFDPNSPDSDNDGVPDAEEWLTGGDSRPGDADGDGFPDAVENEAGSDPLDPSSTPLNTGLGSGRPPAVIIAGPASSRAVRPARPASPGFAISQPQSPRAIRPEFGGVVNPGRTFVSASPASSRGVRPSTDPVRLQTNGAHIATPRSSRLIPGAP